MDITALGAPMNRAANGMVVMDYTNEATIDRIDYNTDVYTVLTEIYIFQEAYYSTLFCLEINMTTLVGTDAKW